MIPSKEAWVCNTVHQGGCLPLKSLPCRKLSWYNQREIELGWWVYRMLSAGVADVCAIIMLWALNFYCRTIASNNFYVCDQCVTNSPEFQKRSKKSEEVFFCCISLDTLNNKETTDLSMYGIVDSDSLRELKYVASLPGP